MPWAMAINLNGESCFQTLQSLRNRLTPTCPEFYVIGREKAKLSYQWRPAVIKRRMGDFCPKCGQLLLDQDGVPLPVFETNTQGKLKKKYFLPKLFINGDGRRTTRKSGSKKNCAVNNSGSQTSQNKAT